LSQIHEKEAEESEEEEKGPTYLYGDVIPEGRLKPAEKTSKKLSEGLIKSSSKTSIKSKKSDTTPPAEPLKQSKNENT